VYQYTQKVCLPEADLSGNVDLKTNESAGTKS
jgi:hypothetical protein